MWYNMVPQNNNKLCINTHKSHIHLFNPFQAHLSTCERFERIPIHFNYHPQFCTWNHCILPAFLQTSLVRRSLHIKLFFVSVSHCIFVFFFSHLNTMSLFSMKIGQGLTTQRNLPQITSLEINISNLIRFCKKSPLHGNNFYWIKRFWVKIYPISCVLQKNHPSTGTCNLHFYGLGVISTATV